MVRFPTPCLQGTAAGRSRVISGWIWASVVLGSLIGASNVHAQDAKGDIGLQEPETSKSGNSGAVCIDGNAAGYPCSLVDLVGFLPLADMGARPGIALNDAWGWVDPETDQRWALMGREDGVAFVEITDPANPRYAGELPMPSTAQANVWRDIKVDGWYTFVVADGSGGRQGLHGMQVFDLRRLRSATGAPVTFGSDAHYTEFNVAHNIVVNEETDRAYVVGARLDQRSCSSGLHIVDISDPLSPTFAGCFADRGTGRAGTGYVHDAQCVVYEGPDRTYQGREICVGSNETAISIADVTDAANPVGVSRGTYPSAAYVHQGWFTEDHQYFIQNDELDERVFDERTHTYIWDVRDLDDPVLLTAFVSDVVSTDHNLYVRDSFVYQANYSSGLRVMDISDPSSPFIAGHFDTRPNDSAVNFAGAWTAWPFPDSDLVIISSRGEGLFVVRPSPLLGTRFTGFNATADDGSVELSWGLNQAANLERFEIVRIEADDIRAVVSSVTPAPSQTDFTASFESEEGIFRFAVVAVSESGDRIESDIQVVNVLSGEYLLDPLWPNPAHASTRSTLAVARGQVVRVSVHDALGREQMLLLDERITSDLSVELAFDTALLPPGTYYLRILGERFSGTRPFVVAR